jgi:hypothetical protein
MPKISRRYRVVTIPLAEDDAKLAELRAEVVAQQGIEDAVAGRFSTKSKAAAKALEYDKFKAQAEKNALKITVYALAYDEFGPFQDRHAPRDEDDVDKRVGYNRETFPHALLKACLVEPDTAEGETLEDRLDDLVAKGDREFAELGRPSPMQYKRLEEAAWEVNVGDDSLPKFSAVSLLKEAKERGSKQQHDSE